MYLTIKETAEYLSLPEPVVNKLILERKIRAIHDGEGYLIYKDQFETYFEQLATYKKMVDDYRNEPIPEDIDIKDED